LSQEYEYKYPA